LLPDVCCVPATPAARAAGMSRAMLAAAARTVGMSAPTLVLTTMPLPSAERAVLAGAPLLLAPLPLLLEGEAGAITVVGVTTGRGLAPFPFPVPLLGGGLGLLEPPSSRI